MRSRMGVSFFQRHSGLQRAVVRPVEADDQRVLTLVQNAARLLVTSSPEEVGPLLVSDPALVLEVDSRPLAVVGSGWLVPPVAWLRTLALDARIAAADALTLLLPELHKTLARKAINVVAITIDDWNSSWLRGPLERLDYRVMVEVVGYQKQRMDLPDHGNRSVLVRQARHDDLAAVLAMDTACFELPWVKGAEILLPAIHTSPCFLVAEQDKEIVGYAFVTVHHAGWQAHLVRIAVDPPWQGRAIGVRLLSEVVRFCATSGVHVLSLNTQADNYHAQCLYEWFGFVRNDERQSVLGCTLAQL